MKDYCLIIYLMPSIGRSYEGSCNVLVRNIHQNERELVTENGLSCEAVDLHKILPCPFYKDSVMILVKNSDVELGLSQVQDYRKSHESKVGRMILEQVRQMSSRLAR